MTSHAKRFVSHGEMSGSFLAAFGFVLARSEAARSVAILVRSEIPIGAELHFTLRRMSYLRPPSDSEMAPQPIEKARFGLANGELP
jgi:hypothetical protein